MSSASYWEKRKAQRMFEYMQSAEDTADEIAKLYLRSSEYLSAELDKIYERYKRKHHLTDAEAYRLLNCLHDKTSIEELKEALRAGDGVERIFWQSWKARHTARGWNAWSSFRISLTRPCERSISRRKPELPAIM